MATSPLTVDQFAAKLKAKYPQYASIPDAQLVEKVVAKYPQYKSQIGGSAPSAPGAPPDERKPFTDRVLSRIGENAEGMSRMPGAAMQDARQRYDARKDKGEGGALGAAQSATEGAYYNAIEPSVRGAYSLTPPGIIERLANKEDPAKLAGDALMLYAPGGEEAGRAFDSTLKAPDPTAAGPLRGSMTRGKSMLDRVDAAARDIPINHQPAYQWAQKAMELGKHGFTVPKPISDFVAWVDSRSKGGADSVGSGAFMDRPGDLHPLPYQVSRNFEQALGAKIPWDSDPGGRMTGIMKKMRESLGQETAAALKPHGLDVPYLKGKAELTKGYGAKGKYGIVGKLGGKIAGYGAGGVVGHPLILGHLGGTAGEGAAGSMVDSIINAGGEK